MWSSYKAKTQLIFVNVDKKRIVQKYTAETFDEDMRKLEQKVKLECPEERKIAIKRELLNQEETTIPAMKSARKMYSFPIGTAIPEYLQMCENVDEINLILRLGVETKHRMDDIAKNKLLNEIEVETIAKYESMKSEYEKKVLSLKEEVSFLRDSIQKYRQTYDDDIKKHFLEGRKVGQSDTEMKTSLLDKQNEELRNEKNGLMEQVKALTQVRLNSSNLGKEGEFTLEGFLQNVFPECSFGKLNSHSGDLMQEYKHLKIMWEAKNHNTRVKKEDVDKFLRDMKENINIDIGIMVAMNASIDSHNSNNGFEIEYLRDNEEKPHRCVVYLSNFKSHSNPSFIIRMLATMFSYICNRTPVESDVVIYMDKLKALYGLIAKQQDNWKKYCRDFKKGMEETNKFYQELEVLVKKLLENEQF